jgi:hypothetical protein
MGEPRRVPGCSFDVGNDAGATGLFPRPSSETLAPFAAKIQSYCDTGDPFCAWRLGGHVSSATYEKFTQGVATTSRDTLIVLSVNEDTVTARLVAVQTDGSVRTYQGAYLVRDGVITQASVRQIG